MQHQFYSIHGVTLRVSTNDASIASAVETLLRHFARESLEEPPALECCLYGVKNRAAIPITASPSAQVFFSRQGKTQGDRLRLEWKCTIYGDEGCQIADLGEQGMLRIDGPAGRVDGYLIVPEAMHLDVRISYLRFALTELLKARGVYTVHATALEKDGRGVLIPGSSGRGKTTSCISLLRAGYRCLSDDHPFVRENGAGPEVLSFPVKIDVTANTVQLFPELRAAEPRLHLGMRKRYFYVDELYPERTADSCEPALILLPQVVDSPQSRVEPLSRSRTLEELLRHGMLVFDKEIARRQLEVFSRLVEMSRCYRLYYGADVLDLPQLIDPLLN